MSACTHKTPNPQYCFHKRRLMTTPQRHRLPDGQFSSLYLSLALFQLVWRRLREVLLSFSSLARQIHPFLLSRHLCRFALNMKAQSAIIFAGRKRRSQFEHDHRRRADRAPQITASFTRGRRRAHLHICWGKLGSDRIDGEMIARMACASRPEGRPWTGRSRALVEP